MIPLRSSFKIGILLLFLRISTAIAELPLKEAPCDYWQTVSLEDYEKLPNGSYRYDDIIVPANETGTYDYEIPVGDVKLNVPSHVRGCICGKLRTCISICCPFDDEYHNGTCLESDYFPYDFIDVTTKEGKTISANISHQFAFQYHRPCNDLYYYQPDIYSYDNYTIMENGSLYKFEDNVVNERDTYCLSPKMRKGIFKYTPLQCLLINPETPSNVKLNGVALVISVPFMILTIIVYLILPDLRSIHGLSLCCYLGGMSIGYLLLAYMIFESIKSSFWCTVLGYSTYFAFMSGFFWLTVISFELYYNIRRSGTNQKMKQFRLYCLYAWGLSLICLICTYTAQQSSYINNSWKSGIGGDEYCFISATFKWGAMIYFYGPILLIVSFNIVMFVLTFRKTIQQSSFHGTHTPHHKHKALFINFLRLFIIMGLTWVSEVLSYVTPRGSWLHNIFSITDFLNAIQGVVIFVLFVCRKSVKNQLLKKFGKNKAVTSDQTQEMTQCI